METPDTQQAIYEFQDFGLIWDHTIGIYGGPYGREHGVAYIGDYGTLVVDRAGWKIIPEYDVNKKAKMEKQPLKVRTGEASGLDLHVMNFLECIRTREKPNADIEIGAHIARIAHLGNIAYRTGRKVFWDAANNNIINDPEASKLVNASYRAPWKVPVV
jgi:predicted dehydrogenase